jgi:hypothetical protein
LKKTVEKDESSFEYEITQPGLIKAEKALQDPEFKSKYEIILHSLQATGHLSASHIRKLSYGEPEFRSARAKRANELVPPTPINPEFPTTLRIADLAREVGEKDFRMKLSDKDVALLYLKLVETLALVS